MTKPEHHRLREIHITPEGWIYLTILCFISLGAVLRNVNLLILMAGMMLAPLLINWRLGVLWLKSLSAQRVLPHRLHARQMANVQWICRNKAKLSVWNIEIRDTLWQDALPTGGARNGPLKVEMGRARPGWSWPILRRFGIEREALGAFNARQNILHIDAGKSESTTVRVCFLRRGRVRAGPAVVSTRFPLGLLNSQILIPAERDFFVAPAIGKLTPVWERRVRSSAIGSDSVQRKRGLEEDEFFALRPWRSGDGRKHIHWRTTAKLGQPVVKQHEQPDNRDFAMLLDLHSIPHVSISANAIPCPKCETVVSFAATVMLQVGSAVQGKIALAICGQETAICRSRNRRELLDDAMLQLAIAAPRVEALSADSLLELAASVSANTPLYIVSTRERAAEFAFLESNMASFDSLTEDGEAARDIRDGENEPWSVRRLKILWPSVRWLFVDSPEFANLFSENSESDHRELRSFADKWRSENVAT